MAGEAAEISSQVEASKDRLKMKVVATESKNRQIENGILMKFEIEYISGLKTIQSSPQILTKADSKATITVADSKGNEELVLKVVATRK